MAQVKSLAAAIRDYFNPTPAVRECKEFLDSLSDDEKVEYREWFRSNGYPDIP